MIPVLINSRLISDANIRIVIFSEKSFIILTFTLYLSLMQRYPCAFLKSSSFKYYLRIKNMEKWPRGRRRSPAKGVHGLSRVEGSNPSFSAIYTQKSPLENSSGLFFVWRRRRDSNSRYAIKRILP